MLKKNLILIQFGGCNLYMNALYLKTTENVLHFFRIFNIFLQH